MSRLRRGRQRVLGAVLLSLGLSGCASGGLGLPPAAAAGSPRLQALEYRFRPAADLSVIAVELCMQGKPPERLVYGSASAAAFVRSPRLISLGGERLPAPRSLAVQAKHIVLGELRGDACIAYEVDLAGALERDLLLLAYPTDSALITSVELFLWRPARRPADLVARARFELPDGMQVSVPWLEQDGGYRLDESAFAFTGHAVFGRFERLAVSVPSGTISAAIPAGFSAEQLAAIHAWLASAGTVVSLATGRFPRSHAQVIVLPTSPSASPIRFGHTGRSGGASVVIFVPTDIDRASLCADWIAIHEFSHLLHPFVRREDAWLSEGLATYLQEVLRVRSGLMPAELAWRRLYEGAALGQEADGSLASETKRMPHAGNYQRVYWAGAALALMADVELRRISGGSVSLERTLAKLGEEQGLMLAPATADSLIAALDRAAVALVHHATPGAARAPVFRGLADRYLEAPALPDLAALYGRLGLGENGLQLTADAPLSSIRAAIMAPALDRSSLPLWQK
jgi:hypothetical protein